MENKQKLIIILLVGFYLVGFGFGVGHFYDANLESPGHWLLLMFASLFSYNVTAYFYDWTIFGGPGVVIGVGRDKFDRLGGAIVSGIFTVIFMYMWFNNLVE